MGDTCRSPKKRVVPTSSELDTILDLLSNPLRRRVLYRLARRESDVLDFETIADDLLESGDDVVPDDPRRLSCQLHHVILPKLADSAQIEYDVRSKTIRVDLDQALERYVEYVAVDERSK